MESNIGVDINSLTTVDEGIRFVVLKLMGYDLIACEISWELRDMIARDLVPPKKLQMSKKLLSRMLASDETKSFVWRAMECSPNIQCSSHCRKNGLPLLSVLRRQGLQRKLTALRPSMVALVPVAGTAPLGPQTSKGCCLLARAYSGGRSVMWSECR